MRKFKFKILLLFILFFSTVVFSSTRFSLYTIIQAVVDAQKIYELPVYIVEGKQEKYILLKDLAKIFSATLTYHAAGKYVSFNCRGEKIYFYFDRDYFVTSKQRVYLSSKVMNIQNRTFVPVSILSNTNFCSIFNFDIEYKKEQNLLIINWMDTINVSYYVTKNSAKVEIRYPQNSHFEYDIDIEGIFITFFLGKTRLKEYKIEGSVISRILLYQKNSNAICEILLVEKNVEIKKEEYGNKLVFYIYKKLQTTPQISVSSITLPSLTTANSIVKNNSKIETKNEKNAKKIIVIDPGHGGEDPGAIGKYGTKEKDINLLVAKLLAQKLVEEGYIVYLTREEDIFVPLVKRTEFANSKNADLFISIHCNAAEKHSGTDHGFEIYFLSEKATDPTAVATEKLENEVIKFEKQTEELSKLQKILWSMIVNEFINESSKLCSYIGEEVTRRTKQNYRGVKQAGFYVLRGAQMPAVLVEIGFISHPLEELKLVREDFLQLIADGICAGIKRYYENER